LKIASLIARILLGALFVFAGSNHIFNFLPAKGPMPPGPAGQFLSGMLGSGYFYVVGFFQVLSGLLLLVNRFVPLALTVLAAVIFNILVVDVLMAHQALPVGVVLVLLWCLIAWPVRSAFLPLLQSKAAS
jgi:putative oxidoreductase